MIQNVGQREQQEREKRRKEKKPLFFFPINNVSLFFFVTVSLPFFLPASLRHLFFVCELRFFLFSLAL